MVDENARRNVDRRRFLQQAGLAVGAGAVLPLFGAEAVLPLLGAEAATASGVDPDQLLLDGRFDEAERAFRRVLHRDPDNAHAAAQLGYIALLSNRFDTASITS